MTSKKNMGCSSVFVIEAMVFSHHIDKIQHTSSTRKGNIQIIGKMFYREAP